MNFKNELVIFIPSIEDGGVEKNLYLITNYLSKKIENISLITSSKNKIKKFDKKINYISPKSTFWNNKNRRYKTLICLFILNKKIVSNKNILLFSFQANIYALIIANLFKIKIVVRSNTAPAGWNKNFFKKIIFRFFYKRANLVIVNSKYFQKQMKNELNISSECIYTVKPVSIGRFGSNVLSCKLNCACPLTNKGNSSNTNTKCFTWNI